MNKKKSLILRAWNMCCKNKKKKDRVHMSPIDLDNEIGSIKKDVKKVAKSLSHFMRSGHMADNICHLTTNASTLNVLAEKLNEIRELQNTVKDLLLSHDDEFKYRLLSRLKSDCEYYLGHGNRHKKDLWASDEKKQIHIMIELHNSFSPEEKPEWLTMKKILEYSSKMIITESKEHGRNN